MENGGGGGGGGGEERRGEERRGGRVSPGRQEEAVGEEGVEGLLSSKSWDLCDISVGLQMAATASVTGPCSLSLTLTPCLRSSVQYNHTLMSEAGSPPTGQSWRRPPLEGHGHSHIQHTWLADDDLQQVTLHLAD
ncbi:hypothetical protein INR49_026192 [Caranx melampygus]|nr:hypothetical protein INR49_026192 [Caranx melampygus]